MKDAASAMQPKTALLETVLRDSLIIFKVNMRFYQENNVASRIYEDIVSSEAYKQQLRLTLATLVYKLVFFTGRPEHKQAQPQIGKGIFARLRIF